MVNALDDKVHAHATDRDLSKPTSAPTGHDAAHGTERRRGEGGYLDKLPVRKLSEAATVLNKLFVGAAFDNLAAVHHQDLISAANC